MTVGAAPVAPPVVEVFGIRHHGPGSARSLLRALDDLAPTAVLIEGPSDADPLVGLVTAPGMEPPVALLAYVADEPQRAAFWPYAVFSPEWQAMTWAVGRGVPVRFCDLPAASMLALERDRAASAVHLDPLGTLAAAAGYDDAERWWDDVVESRLDGHNPFPALSEAMAALREDQGPGDQVETWREAWMRQTIRAALKEGHERVAVVCGAWHAPALTLPLRPAVHDSRALQGLPKRKVSLTWVPWTHSRLATSSGYGAGVGSPGWYHHLWTAPDRPITRWLATVAGSLRERDLPVSTAHVIEAVRLAEGLAALRGRPLAGLAEVTDATRSVLCDGDEVAVRFVSDHLVVGEALGSVADDAPTVPLEADLVALARRLKVKREALARKLDLDLRKPFDGERSRLFHRLRILGIAWATPARSDVHGTGTFRETWQLEWKPELALGVVEAAIWGTTVESAAVARLLARSEDASLAGLTAGVEQCLLADLPDALPTLVAALDQRAALDADVLHLMEALPALVRSQRYGDVRNTDTSALARVSQAMLMRICAALPQAVTALDDDGATDLRAHLEKVHAAVALTVASRTPESALGEERWLGTLRRLVDRHDLNGLLLGRVVRLLHDGGHLEDSALRLRRALSYGVPADAKAGFVDGFFAEGALLLIHSPELLALLDTWVTELTDQEFTDVLPLVRRTFGSYSVPERRSIAERVKSGQSARAPGPSDDVDHERGLAAVATVRLILGRP